MSYVHADDQHEGGRLTAFRERLSGELRMQTGDDFDIFQDRKDIKWGQQWKGRIEISLDAATFLFPIITPGYFKSTACREELERFLSREKELGRKDLIFPIYYISCPLLHDEKLRSEDQLALAVGDRQYADWRESRFEPFTSPQIGKMLANLASQIVQALERTEPIVTSAARLTGSAKEEPVSVPASEASDHAAGTRGPTDQVEPRTLIVDALHRSGYTTLNAALEAADAGDRIVIRPGLYKEGVVVDKPIEIIGDGELGDCVIEASGQSAIRFRASMGRITNLVLRQIEGEEKWFCVDIGQGRLDLEGCEITSRGLACVAIRGGADPRLRRNRIHDGRENGVLVYQNGQGTLEDNDIFDTEYSGVEIKNGGNFTLRRNRIHNCRQSGVFVYGGQGTLEDNEIFSNTNSGVAISEGGNATLRRNRIHDGSACGVFVYENGRGTLEDNEIFSNGLAQVQIKTGGNPTLRRNRIHDGRASGVFIYENGRGTLEDNEIFGNANAGVTTSEGGNPTLRRNTISKNRYEAVWIYEDGRGVFENHDLRNNARGAWDIEDDCVANVTRSANRE